MQATVKATVQVLIDPVGNKGTVGSCASIWMAATNPIERPKYKLMANLSNFPVIFLVKTLPKAEKTKAYMAKKYPCKVSQDCNPTF